MITRTALATGLYLTGLVLSGCGPGGHATVDGGSRAGTGGSPTGAGGSPTGAGGAGAAIAVNGCPAGTPAVTSPAIDLIGAAMGTDGALYEYTAPGLVAAEVNLESADGGLLTDGGTPGNGLIAVATPGAPADTTNTWLGFGVEFACKNASAFTGVQFTLAGTLGSCTLGFSVGSYENEPCAAGACYSGLSPETLQPGTDTVHFTDITGGYPFKGVDPTSVVNVQWTLGVPTAIGTPPCEAKFTVSNVHFVSD
jgi:hypothetical protein